MGFIKGVPYEFAPSNANPVGVMDRFWESHDFIIKAMTTHDGPFNWESEHFHYRQVNCLGSSLRCKWEKAVGYWIAQSGRKCLRHHLLNPYWKLDSKLGRVWPQGNWWAWIQTDTDSQQVEAAQANHPLSIPCWNS
jgi:hypothetical protein